MALKQNIIYIYFKGKHLVTSKSQYQYNHGQYLYFADLNLPQAFEVHFSNKDKGESKTQIGSNKLVEIPDEYFWSGASQIYAWVYLHSEINDGETIYEVRIPLIKRAKPTDEEPLPQQESVMERAIAELNNAVEITTENANKTEADKTQVSNIKEDIIDLKEDIDNTADTVDQKAQEAINASLRSEASAQNAAEYESGAHNYSRQAEQSASEALGYKNIAKQKAEIVTDASAEALGYRDEALDAKNKAEQAKQNIVDYRDETKGYRDDALNIKNDVQILKGQIDNTASNVSDISASVRADAQSASNSANSASQSADSASQSSNSASQSASRARQSEISAYNSANSASQSAEQVEQFMVQSETNVSHYPKVVNGFWYVWDANDNEYKNTNVDARGLKGDKGDKGDTGNGISNTVLNADYTLTVTFTDGTSYTSPSIRGEKGLKGDKGDTGNGIASTVLNNDYTLTITFTDGTTYTTPSIRGQQGEKGDKGDVGESSVYIGADEPQDEGIKVWIDTDEAGTEADLIQDVVDLKEENKKIIANLATDTASGSIASFSDGADDLPLKSLVVNIDPIQDLHGQDSPYPAGGGKNLLNPAIYRSFPVTNNGVTATLNSDGTISLTGKATATSYLTVVNYRVLSGYEFLEPDVTYKLSGGVSSDVRLTFGINGSGTDYADVGIGKAMSFTAEQIASLQYRVLITVANGVNADGITIKPMIEKGNTKTSFAPYENICPISGWDAVGVEQRGKNLFDKANAQYINGYFTGSVPSQIYTGNAFCTVYIPCKPNTTYRMLNKNNSGKRYVGYTTELPRNGVTVYASALDYTTTGTDAKYLVCYVFNSGTDSTTLEQVLDGLQIELGEATTPYDPYTGRSITISLGQTVYGGRLDVISGVMTVDNYAEYDGSEAWMASNAQDPQYFMLWNQPHSVSNTDASQLANWATYGGGAYQRYGAFRAQTNGAVVVGNLINRESGNYKFANVADFKAFLSENPLQVVYELAEPIEIQLDSHTLNSLYGQNNIWADSGDTTAEYRADTSLYVKRKITEAIADLS